MDKEQVSQILNELLAKNCDPAQAQIMQNIMSNFLKDIKQKDLDELESKFKKTLKKGGSTIFD